jgi:hypothetical protein
MKRPLAGMVAGLLVLASAPAFSGDGPAFVTPNPVRRGKILKVAAEGCVSGDPWTAYVEIDLLRGGLAGTQLVHREKLADDDGSTVFKVRLKKKKFKRGKHTATVECVHDFPMGGPGSYYDVFRHFRVKRARS